MSSCTTNAATPSCSSNISKLSQMPELKSLPAPILIHIAKALNIALKGITSVIELLDEGATVPFIARYRKEMTGNLDEVQIRDVQEKLEDFRELEERGETE